MKLLGGKENESLNSMSSVMYSLGILCLTYRKIISVISLGTFDILIFKECRDTGISHCVYDEKIGK